MGFCDCCFGVSREQRQEEDRLASEEARSRAAEAAQRRQPHHLSAHLLGASVPPLAIEAVGSL